MVSANPRLSMGCQDYYFTWFSDNHALNNIGQGLVVRSLVSANRWLRGIKTYRFPWYLTPVSANHASSNPGQVNRHISQGTKCLFTLINSIISSGEK